MLEANKLSFSYTGAPPYVLEGLHMRIRDGEYVSVVGDNGSGKSTLIRLASGFPITVREMLFSYGKLLKLKNRRAALEALGQVGMEAYASELAGNLSGGQYQKVLIARALMGEPELLILDEPSTGIDRESQRDIYAFLKRLNLERGITIVSVEHNLDAAVKNSTSIYHLANGRGHLCTPEQYAREYLTV